MSTEKIALAAAKGNSEPHQATILVVDDRPTNRQFLTTLLGYSGFSLREASDGTQALEIARDQRPDLVITDILMPKMDGFELVHQIRVDPDLSGIPVVFYTATYREPEARALAKECGAQDVIIKPTEPQIILEKVNHWLGYAQGIHPQGPAIREAPSSEEFRDRFEHQLGELHAIGMDIEKQLREDGPATGWSDRLEQSLYALTSSLTLVQRTGEQAIGLAELGFRLLTERDLLRLVDLYSKEALDLLRAKAAVIGLFAEDEFTLKHVFLTQVGAPTVEKIGQWTSQQGVIDQVIKLRSAVRGRAKPGDLPNIELPDLSRASLPYIGVPIQTMTQLDGVAIFFGSPTGTEFGQDDEQLAVSLAMQFGLVFENQHLYDQVQHHATDLRIEVNERQQAQLELMKRERQQSAVARLGQRALEDVDLRALMDETVEVLAETLDAEYAKSLELLPDNETLILRAGKGWEAELIDHARVGADGRFSMAGYTLVSPDPLIVEDFLKETRFTPSELLREHAIRSGMSVIIPSTPRAYGVLCVHSRIPRHYSPDDASFLQTVAHVLAETIGRKRAEDALRERQVQVEVHHRLLEQRELERLQIARDLHDGPIQELIAVTFEMECLLNDLKDHSSKESAREIQQAVQAQVDSLRTFCSDLRPPTITKFGLIPAIYSYLDTFREKHPEIAIQVELEPVDMSIPEIPHLAIYRIFQECLNNTVKHSKATQVHIHLEGNAEELRLMILDNGVGFSVPEDWVDLARQGHLGLVGMRERAEAIGATLVIQSTPGKGTTLQVMVPLTRTDS